LIVLAIIAGAAALLSGGRAPSLGAATTPQGVPPIGSIWFGSSFDPRTFALSDRAERVREHQGFSLVAHLSRVTQGNSLKLLAWWEGKVVTTTAVTDERTADVWGFALGPVLNPGRWIYDLTDASGNVLASGSIYAVGAATADASAALASPEAIETAPSTAPSLSAEPSDTAEPSPPATAAPTAAPLRPTPTPRPTAPLTSKRYDLLSVCPDTADCWVYVVRSGDNLFSIANYFGVPLSAVEQRNPWTSTTPLVAGQKLLLPTPTR
jgi:hypothetical protein